MPTSISHRERMLEHLEGTIMGNNVEKVSGEQSGAVPQRLPRVSKQQMAVLEAVRDQNVSGMCLKWPGRNSGTGNFVWTFILGSVERVTAHVKYLESKGLVHITYYGGGSASVNVTEAGQSLLDQKTKTA